jgi:hypothetical protein
MKEVKKPLHNPNNAKMKKNKKWLKFSEGLKSEFMSKN